VQGSYRDVPKINGSEREKRGGRDDGVEQKETLTNVKKLVPEGREPSKDTRL